VEPDIIVRRYEYLIRKFAEGSGQSSGAYYTPAEVGFVMARLMDLEPGMGIYDPCCGSAGLLIKCRLVFEVNCAVRRRTMSRQLSPTARKTTGGGVFNASVNTTRVTFKWNARECSTVPVTSTVCRKIILKEREDVFPDSLIARSALNKAPLPPRKKPARRPLP
jgi:N-6 DNA Methylase